MPDLQLEDRKAGRYTVSVSSGFSYVRKPGHYLQEMPNGWNQNSMCWPRGDFFSSDIIWKMAAFLRISFRPENGKQEAKD